MRSGYFCLMRSASALRFSAGRTGGEREQRRGGCGSRQTKGVLILKLGSHCRSDTISFTSKGLMKEINKDSEMDVANRVSRGGRTVRVWYTPHYVSEAATRLIWKASLKLNQGGIALVWGVSF